jgi:hypothetical protein
MLGAGVAAASLPLLVWIVGTGIWNSFIEAVFSHNLAYVGFPFRLEKWVLLARVVFERFAPTEGLLWVCMLLGVAGQVWRAFREDRAVRFAGWWFLSSLLGVALGPYGFGHYFLQVLPPLAMMPGAIWRLAVSRLPLLAPHRRVAGGLLAAFLFVPLIVPRIVACIEPADSRSFELYKSYGSPLFVAARELGDYVLHCTDPQERILIVGSEPEILFYARRRSATRYTIFYPLTGDFPRAKGMTEELFAEIAAHPPARIIVCDISSFIVVGRGARQVLGISQRLASLLRAGYQEEAKLWTDGAGQVLLTRPGAPEPPDGCAFVLYRRIPDTP